MFTACPARSSLLKKSDTALTDSAPDAGASSLKLVQLHVKLTQQGHRHLQATDLFGYPNARALAQHLNHTQPANDTREQPRQTRLVQRNARRLRRSGGGS